MPVFKYIREHSLKIWNEGLVRSREEGERSDDYSKSKICSIQVACTAEGHHCSILCSLGDWLDNVSDALYDTTFDDLDTEEPDSANVLFRYYTRLLLVVSEVMEDLEWLHLVGIGLEQNSAKRYEAGRDLEKSILANEELKKLSGFINSICKHKAQSNNFHVDNHHLDILFEDGKATKTDNQFSIDNMIFGSMDKDTTILIPRLNYFIMIIVVVYNKVLELMMNDQQYKERIFAKYNDPWQIEVDPL
jgi:hypothetical protein